MIYRGHTFALRPTNEQAVLFEQFSGVCRLVWNLALEQREKWWSHYQRNTGNTLNYYSQITQLKDLRADFDWIKAVSQTSQSRTLLELEDAFKRFFKGIAAYPKYKKRGSGDCFSFNGRELVFERLNAKWSKVRLPKIGWVKFRNTKAVTGKITEATVKRTAIGWQISIGVKSEGSVPDNGKSIGIDRGVIVPLMLSDGTEYHLPKQLSVLSEKHRKAQRIISRRRKGSKRWLKALKLASSIKAKEARVRKHWAHCATTAISQNFSTIVVERLRTKDMTKSSKGTVSAPGNKVAQKRGLNRAIMNIGWRQIETMLAYKTAVLIKVNPAYSSQACASCGNVSSNSRKNQAVFVCTRCGHQDNADRNAAIIILNRGITPGVEDSHGRADEARTSVNDTDRNLTSCA